MFFNFPFGGGASSNFPGHGNGNGNGFNFGPEMFFEFDDFSQMNMDVMDKDKDYYIILGVDEKASDDDIKKAFLALNSWGPSWGDNGYIWIGYEYLPQLTNDLYVMGL